MALSVMVGLSWAVLERYDSTRIFDRGFRILPWKTHIYCIFLKVGGVAFTEADYSNKKLVSKVVQSYPYPDSSCSLVLMAFS